MTKAEIIRGTPITEYQAIHHWLRKYYGKADICESKDCKHTSKKFSWALLPDKKYEKKRENFIKLCRHCHAKMDVTDETRTKIKERMKGVTPHKAIEANIKNNTGVKRPEFGKWLSGYYIKKDSLRTHCAYGHALEGDNVIHTRFGTRRCRTCYRAYYADYSRKRRRQIKYGYQTI